MTLFNGNSRCTCPIAALIASVIVGVVTAFLQITAVITVAPVFLWVTFGIAVAYLGILTVAAALTRRTAEGNCTCSALRTVLAGILGTVLFAAILLAVGIVATSILSAILVGLLLFFFALTLTGTACFVRAILGCED